ncbi:MAG: bifunctional phosphoribosylaminoimidazolecarboxamide formyltransferase/IMP cyclohydrolase PurH [Bacteroidetes bacterium]|nr:MAG: bifunctional phosphoribosylaminoimidazolecarboxamide formyltransferase/IMP cyclohydrolase PurH [Bacteroidota bacterium]RLD94107.1 MAG: bifunctional phosphoribosylaminoimidazolecarboxamide formyltransferase/IMP cyclohydrolase PurH [Bacteroidota bacterium]
MATNKAISSALISVFSKEGLDLIVKKLHELGIALYSTGGTQRFIEGLEIPVTPVEDLTSYPSILGGRVKTLHPKVFGGILARREEAGDLEQLDEYQIPKIDLVIVDLYPFEDTVRSDASEQEIIEKIDIGGISLIRAAAKNFKDVLVVGSREQYDPLLALLESGKGLSSLEDRKAFASQAFNVSSHYDSEIFKFFDGDGMSALKISEKSFRKLRYGENPHQQGHFYGELDAMFEQLHGKEISYNNLLDIDAAVGLIAEFEACTFAIMKHNNACGLATREKLVDAWKDALAGDPVSAFGGVLITNREIDLETAEEMNKIFFEVIIAPSFNEDALKVLQQKKNRIILIQKSGDTEDVTIRTALNGVLVQDRDLSTEMEAQMKVATKTAATPEQLADLVFANKIVKHTKSNAIVLAKNQQLVASGVGQTSRVDALKQSIEKAKHFEFDLEGAVMASDAFFPFADSVEIAKKAGVRAVVQPGGSIRDQDSIDFCDANGMAMVFTGIRHFKH